MIAAWPVVRRLAPAVAAALVVSCSGVPEPLYHEEDPVRSGRWVVVRALPAWVEAPPAREGWWRVVVSGASNDCGIAVAGDRPSPADDRELRRKMEEALAPVCGDVAKQVIDALFATATMVHRARKYEVLTTEAVPGNTLCTAWALWEAPLEPALAILPAERRAAAGDALSTHARLR
ncbi:MAG TPA: hypothetical protein VK081_08235 [Planctomycetota bacterium]|nr:hypothetical protein [Planctomycetota bacterium]